MSIASRQSVVPTSHGSLAVEESGNGDIPLLMIHGNSFCRGVFRHQLQSDLAQSHRLIAFDLPGHGESSNAPEPERSYTRSGLADATIELLDKLGIEKVTVLGWSLGGHIAMEMLPRFPGMQGLMILGAPPVGPKNMVQGFRSSPQLGTAGRQDISGADIERFVTGIFGDSAEPFLRDAVARADRRFRKILFEALRAEAACADAGPDAREIVESSPVPLAVVNGAEDHIVHLDYFDSLAYANLWEGHAHRLAGLGHAPFWRGPGLFNPLLKRFLSDVEKQ